MRIGLLASSSMRRAESCRLSVPVHAGATAVSRVPWPALVCIEEVVSSCVVDLGRGERRCTYRHIEYGVRSSMLALEGSGFDPLLELFLQVF